MSSNEVLIQVKDLKKHYNKGTIKALDGVSVDINRGDVMVVIGPSGSGKSTLLRSLNLLEEPTSGAIVFDGVDITKKKYKSAEDATGRPVMVKVNIDEQPELASRYNIMSIPTLMVFRNGVVTEQAVGVRPKSQILSML